MPSTSINRQSNDPSREGRVALLGLSDRSEEAWRVAADAAQGLAIPCAAVSDCRRLVNEPGPTAIVVSSWPKIDAQLLNAADLTFRRAAVVVAAPDPREADYWRNLAWDAAPAESEHRTLVTTLKAALTEAERRRKAWDLVDEYYRRYELLSRDELQVLQAVCDGQLNKQIAAGLGVSIRTVEQRRRRVFNKMGVESAVPLADRVATVRTLESQRMRRHAAAPPLAPNFGTGVPAPAMSHADVSVGR